MAQRARFPVLPVDAYGESEQVTVRSPRWANECTIIPLAGLLPSGRHLKITVYNSNLMDYSRPIFFAVVRGYNENYHFKLPYVPEEFMIVLDIDSGIPGYTYGVEVEFRG